MRELGIEELFASYRRALSQSMKSAYEWPGKTSVTFSLPERADSGRPSYRSYMSVYVNAQRKDRIQVYLQSRASSLVRERIGTLKSAHNSVLEDAKGNVTIDIMSSDDTAQLRGTIAELAAEVERQWQEEILPAL